MGAAASILQTNGAVEPGGEASWDVRVRNTGSLVDQFTLEVLGTAEPWTSIEPPTLELLPSAEGTARLTFRPPRSSAVAPGPLVVGVKAASREDLDGTVVEEATLEVGRFTELFAELVPRTSKGAWRGKHEIGIDNRGNVPINATITATDPDEALRFDPRPPSMSVEPGSAAYGRLKVRPRKRFLFGQPKTVPFDARVEPQEGDPVEAQGNLLQSPIIPRWAPQAIATLAGLVIAWLTLLQPAIESQARDAVNEPVSEQGQRIDSLEKAVDDLNKRVPDDGGGPETTAPVVLGSSFDRRLATNVPKNGANVNAASYSFKKGMLTITDIVFQNPQGDAGSLRILRAGSVLLEVRLENFRDLDYHFVTPLTVLAGPKNGIELRVDCVTPGSAVSPGLDKNMCRPAVYLTGTMRTSA